MSLLPFRLGWSLLSLSFMRVGRVGTNSLAALLPNVDFDAFTNRNSVELSLSA